ncbi:pectinesterase-like [Gossypium australe]|uniref:Pectinesterase-like n=1 Tax=Gossypium australe TaxID=47621 RepID=A0A5B6V7K6_9ROSI|nr:pectinesterase-like [Gossypium australe]
MMKETMQMGIVNANELTGNALTISTKLSDILSKFDIHLNITNSHTLFSQLKSNVIVAKDGSSQFKTIGATLFAALKNFNIRHVIYINAGIYVDYIIIDKQYIIIIMYGNGPRKPIAISCKGVKSGGEITTFLPNPWDSKTPLVLKSTRWWLFVFNQINQPSSIVEYMPTKTPCTIKQISKGFIDENIGTVIQNCKIVPEQKLFNNRLNFATYLGRPWKKFSTTIIMESTLGLDKVNYEDILYYVEYNNRGPSANFIAKVNWKGYHKIDRVSVMKFIVQSFLLSKENWLPLTSIPFTTALRY